MNIRALMEALENEPPKITKEEKKAFLEAVRGFSQLGEGVYGKTNLKELCEKVRHMVEMANHVTLSEERLEAAFEDIGTGLGRYFEID